MRPPGNTRRVLTVDAQRGTPVLRAHPACQGLWVTFFDEAVAARYDETSAARFHPDVLGPTVDVLAELASGGPALEFAVGTGRVALPLSERGVTVHGVELSQPMVDQMMAKPGADRVQVTVGDMATTRVDGEFPLVYLVYSTISNLVTQDEQVRCFENAADHLVPGGHFVVEVGVPSLVRLAPGERFVPFDVSPEHLGVDEYDLVNQRLTSHHHWFSDGTVESFDSEHRYAWPAEYDLMARIAGLDLAHRWGDWQRTPFTDASTAHVSVWTKPT